MTDLSTRLQATLGEKYRIERELGGGGMSRVFLALETALGRRVVIKVLPPELAAGVNTDRFRREIQLAASLQHPHIVPLLAAGGTLTLVHVVPEVEFAPADAGGCVEVGARGVAKVLHELGDELAGHAGERRQKVGRVKFTVHGSPSDRYEVHPHIAGEESAALHGVDPAAADVANDGIEHNI